MGMIQGKNETLKDYLHKFNMERLEVEDDSPNIIMTTLANRVHHLQLSSYLFTIPPIDLDDLMTRAERYMKAKETRASTRERESKLRGDQKKKDHELPPRQPKKETNNNQPR